jgi:hypothetical protein
MQQETHLIVTIEYACAQERLPGSHLSNVLPSECPNDSHSLLLSLSPPEMVKTGRQDKLAVFCVHSDYL